MIIAEFGWIADAARSFRMAEAAAAEREVSLLPVYSALFSSAQRLLLPSQGTAAEVETWTRKKVILTTKVTATVGRIGIRVYRLITSRTTITTPLNTKVTSRTGIPTVITTDLINKIELAKEGAKAIVHYTEEGGRKVAHFIKHL
jgi:hypothetical protein